jgi:ankyrin repeat protein
MISVAFPDMEFIYYLQCAISNASETVIKRLIDPDAPKISGYFPLHIAAFIGSCKVAHILLKLMKQPGQADQDGRNPLHMAALGGRIKMILLPLSKDSISNEPPSQFDGSNLLDVQGNRPQSPLIMASQMGNIQASRLLIKFGAVLDLANYAGRTALHYAIEHCSRSFW